jgi:penicillin V acylase-like amidase (Ntn superfamily)
MYGSDLSDVLEFSTDGMNEAGLTVSSLLFHGSTYETPPPNETTTSKVVST